MKRWIAVLLMAALMLSLTACGTPQSGNSDPTNAATAAPNENEQPGEENEPAEDPTPVETEPVKSQAAVDVENLIAAIGEIVYNPEGEGDSWEAIMNAQNAYDALSAEEKAQVENANVLTEANNTYIQHGCQDAANYIKTQIDEMGEVKTSNRENILEVVRLYKNADKNVQALVENADVLKSAAATLADKLLSKMDCEEDFVRGYNFYYPEEFPWGETYWYADQGCFALPYIGTSSNDVWMRLVFNFNRYDWIFFEDITVAADDDRFYESFSDWDVVRDNGGGEVWEYVDIDVGNYEIEMLWAVANSNKTVIRFEGDDYYYDYTVTDDQKDSIRDALIVYELLSL